MTSSNKALVYDALKTLNNPTEDSRTDFVNNNEELYIPDFAAYFGEGFQDVIDQFKEDHQKESERKVKDKQNETSDSENSSDEENGIFNEDDYDDNNSNNL
ncbi:17129_t:CDS:2 [Funneliformis geosporum]|uniref:17129_t:CDS:1 n=1 Tax=Funneliformis geosporum TaxID=1117311 RepID=A0A9W4SXT4_9GLOM|nr:17129_t:CDS:2 [Funneliformis geosporum]